MANIAGYLHAAAAAAATSPHHTAAGAEPPMFLCEGRATTARQASARVSALAAALVQRLGMQVRRRRRAGVRRSCVWRRALGAAPSALALVLQHAEYITCRMHIVPSLEHRSPPAWQPAQPGDRVCVAALATDRHLEALLAVTAAGGIAAPLNWRWGAAEAAGAAALVGARLLVADAACLRFALGAAGAANGAVSTLLLLGSPAEYRQADLDAAPPGLQLAFAEALTSSCPGSGGLALQAAPGGAALIVYTSGESGGIAGVWGVGSQADGIDRLCCFRRSLSVASQAPHRPLPAGTTGKPKGVTLSHAALHSQCIAKLLVVRSCLRRGPSKGWQGRFLGSLAGCAVHSCMLLYATAVCS